MSRSRDGLDDALRVAGARGSVGLRLRAGGVWGLSLDEPWNTMHLIRSGTAWLEAKGQPPCCLGPGDIAWLPAHVAHGLASQPDLPMDPPDPVAMQRARLAGAELRLGQHPVSTRLLTVHYTQDPEAEVPAIFALRSSIHLRAEDHPSLSALGLLLEQELLRPGVGSGAALNSLVDLVFVQVVRGRFADESRGSALELAIDSVTRDAIILLHSDLDRSWTTTALARAVGVSRATLARRFERALGHGPGSYLTGCRMSVAALRLRDTDESVQAIALAVGYTSVSAFTRAFVRERGSSPRAYRESSRERAQRHVSPRRLETAGSCLT